jgi:hypothetical protein
MKSSFAKTFEDIVNKKSPCDRMDENAVPIFDVIPDDTGTQITPEEICVIQPFNEKEFDSEENILILLANEELRKKYKNVYDELDIAKNNFMKILKKVSRSSNCEQELITTFKDTIGNIYEILLNIQEGVEKSKENFKFKYNNIFDPAGKVKAFLTSNVKLFDQYVEKYDYLIKQSEFFSKDLNSVFGTTEAKNIKDSIEGNEFFLAGHRLKLKNYGEIDNKDSLEEIIDNEINKIFSDNELRRIFDEIDKKLNANKELKEFKKEIEIEPEIVIRLNDYENFRKQVWFSYLKQVIEEFNEVINLYSKKKKDLEGIANEASNEQSKWNDAIDEFNNRFIHQPFTLEVDNKSDAILDTKMPILSFKFEGKPVERKKLLEILSQGEKRAFYLLNIIFKIRVKEVENKRTIIVFDDIADSFDYKNKYAIVEYLNDLVGIPNFYSIILTHNYDFYRTITSRLGIPRRNHLNVIKTPLETIITEEVYQNSPFKTWRECLKSCVYCRKNYSAQDAKKHILALIPFVRNLIEYGGRIKTSTTHGDDYDTLTCLLHSKPKTKNITFKGLKLIYKEHLEKDDFDSTIHDSDLVYDSIIDVASFIPSTEFNLENKIILAMAIRLKAEEFMWSKVSDTTPIIGSQTGVLFQRYKKDFILVPNEKKKIQILESVNIMTPENIHINSFMYEPILDMGVDELKNLYDKVCNISRV